MNLVFFSIPLSLVPILLNSLELTLTRIENIMKKTFILVLLTLISTSGIAAVIKGRDSDNACTLYKIMPSDAKGKVALSEGEVVIYFKEAYGLSFTEMEVNFDNREVLIQPTINIVMGFNLPLIQTKAAIPSDHVDFNFLINQLNRKILLFEKICITQDNKIAYAKMFEQTPAPESKLK